MAENKIPFYTQTAMLDNYIHSSPSQFTKEEVDVLLKLISKKEELRKYFYTSNPHWEWAKEIWERGLLRNPPSKTGTNEMPIWYEQEFLVNVASNVPDVFVDHFACLKGDDWYVSRAFRGVPKLERTYLANIKEKIEQHLISKRLAENISDELLSSSIKLILVDEDDPIALDFLRLLFKPINCYKVDNAYNWHAQSRFKDYEIEKNITKIINLGKAHESISKILEDSIVESQAIEAINRRIKNYKAYSFWRSAIENSDQNIGREYIHRLLDGLRDLVLQTNISFINNKIDEYYRSKYLIFKRLGLFLLGESVELNIEKISSILSKRSNLNRLETHHETFILLQKSFPYLPKQKQESILKAIKSGPPLKEAAKLADWASREYGRDRAEYLDVHNKAWVRDRLWMIKEYLGDRDSDFLSRLITDIGMPDHPEFTSWSSGVRTISEASPISHDEINSLTPDQILDFLEKWRPPSNGFFEDKRISIFGLAPVLAGHLIDNIEEFGPFLYRISSKSSQLFAGLADYFTEKYSHQNSHIRICLTLFSKIVRYKTPEKLSTVKDEWAYARGRIISYLEKVSTRANSLDKDNRDRCIALLLKLLEDPDPNITVEMPPEGYLGHGEPETIAINHNRPRALACLIDLLVNIQSEEERSTGPGPCRIPIGVKTFLAKRLDKKLDPTLSVHSVFGRKFFHLYWLDKNFIDENISTIFPSGDSEKDIMYFKTAWKSYIVYNSYRSVLYNYLKDVYEKALQFVSKTSSSGSILHEDEAFAAHAFFNYISDEKPQTIFKNKPLIKRFFEKASKESRRTACWLIWRYSKENQDELKSHWPKIRELWQWRISVAAENKHSTDFDEELEWFAYFPELTREYESLDSLWPLLEGVLPHISRNTYGHGWHALETYLSIQVDEDPINCIKLYYKMHLKGKRLTFTYHENEARTILNKATANPKSRKTALELIDFLGRCGNYQFKDIYQKYSG